MVTTITHQTFEQILPDNVEMSEEKIIEEYKKLNDKCDILISKIKNRKNKK